MLAHTYPDAIIEALALYNVLRTLGFKLEEIHVSFDYLPEVKVGILAQGMPLYVIDCGAWTTAPVNPMAVWDQACEDWNDQSPVSIAAWKDIFETSNTYRKCYTLTKHLMGRGYELRRPTHYKNGPRGLIQ